LLNSVQALVACFAAGPDGLDPGAEDEGDPEDDGDGESFFVEESGTEVPDPDEEDSELEVELVVDSDGLAPSFDDELFAGVRVSVL
jgi:hypothetical protein